MAIKFKSRRQDNYLGVGLIVSDDSVRHVATIEMPMDGDWRADVEFYDAFIKIYTKRIRLSMRR